MDLKSEEMDKILSLIDCLIQTYRDNSEFNVEQLKEFLEEYLINPYSGHEKAIEVNNKINKLVRNNDDFQAVWRQIDQYIDKNYPETSAESGPYYKEKLRELERKFVNILIEIGKKRGTKETISAIIGYLLIYQNLTQAELKKLSGFSKGAISENLRKLVGIGFVKRRMMEDTRAYQYSIGNDMKALSQNTAFIKLIRGKEIGDFSENKLSELNKIEDQSKEGLELLKERLNELHKFSKIYQNIIRQIRDSRFINGLRNDAK